jgi:hypothetical protein
MWELLLPMLQACAVNLHHSRSHNCHHFLQPMLYRLPYFCFLLCTSFDRESCDYHPKIKRISCDILVCVIYDTSLDFHHNNYRIAFLSFCSWHTISLAFTHLLFNNVSFQPYVLEVPFPFLVSFFAFPFNTCFPFSFAALGKMPVSLFFIISRCYGKRSSYQSLTFVLRCIKTRKAFLHILSADNCHNRRGSTAHRVLLQHT